VQGQKSATRKKENDQRKIFAVFGLAFAVLMTLSPARASEIDQATKLTFSEAGQIPGQILPAGTYWFAVTELNVVQIFNSDRSSVYATLRTASAEHLQAVSNTQITFADQARMRPQVIVTWFYPGRTIGHEFLYSKKEAKELANNKQHIMVAG
jgi:hypothetical protein